MASRYDSAHSADTDRWTAAEMLRSQGAIQAAQAAFRALIHAAQMRRLARQGTQRTFLHAQQIRLRRQLVGAALCSVTCLFSLFLYLGWPQLRYADLPLAQAIVDWLARNELWYLMSSMSKEAARTKGGNQTESDRPGRSSDAPEYLLPPGTVAEEGGAILSYLGSSGTNSPTTERDRPEPAGLPATPIHLPAQPVQTAQLKRNQAFPSGYQAAPFNCPSAPVACEIKQQHGGPGPQRSGLWPVWMGLLNASGSCAIHAGLLNEFSQTAPFRRMEQQTKARQEVLISSCFRGTKQWAAAEEYARRAMCTAEFETSDSYGVLVRVAMERKDPATAKDLARCRLEYAKHYSDTYVNGRTPALLHLESIRLYVNGALSLMLFNPIDPEILAIFQEQDKNSRNINVNDENSLAYKDRIIAGIHEGLAEVFLDLKDEHSFLEIRQKLEANPSYSLESRLILDTLTIMLQMRLGRFRDASEKLEILITGYQQIEDYSSTFDFLGTRNLLQKEAAEQPALREVNEQIMQLSYVMEGERTPQKVQQMAAVGSWLRQQ